MKYYESSEAIIVSSLATCLEKIVEKIVKKHETKMINTEKYIWLRGELIKKITNLICVTNVLLGEYIDQLPFDMESLSLTRIDSKYYAHPESVKAISLANYYEKINKLLLFRIQNDEISDSDFAHIKRRMNEEAMLLAEEIKEFIKGEIGEKAYHQKADKE